MKSNGIASLANLFEWYLISTKLLQLLGGEYLFSTKLLRLLLAGELWICLGKTSHTQLVHAKEDNKKFPNNFIQDLQE